MYVWGIFICSFHFIGTRMIFHIVEALASSPIWVGMCGFGLIVVPILGIAFIHNKEKQEKKD